MKKTLKYTLGFVILLGLGLWITYKLLPVNPTINIAGSPYEGEIPLEKLQLPDGFAIDVWADSVENARSMAYSPAGTLFVGTRSKGKVYAIKDSNQDGRADQKWTLLSEANMPNGVAFRDGDLYVAEVNRVLVFRDIENKLENPGEPEVIFDGYPEETHHGWKYINFGPDGKLYVPVGAPCNICESEEKVFNSITTLDVKTGTMEILHEGVRNTVGFDWHPETGELWFTDNGRDWMGDNLPSCELNRASKENQHFGYPYCHQGDILDEEFGEGKNCQDYMPPVTKLGPHTAPLGMEFYTSNHYPPSYSNYVFIARHGSWNRKKKIGYDVVMVDPSVLLSNDTTSFQTFITGWLNPENDDVWGRPVDVEVIHDGTMLISDDYANVIYRVYYKGDS